MTTEVASNRRRTVSWILPRRVFLEISQILIFISILFWSVFVACYKWCDHLSSRKRVVCTHLESQIKKRIKKGFARLNLDQKKCEIDVAKIPSITIMRIPRWKRLIAINKFGAAALFFDFGRRFTSSHYFSRNCPEASYDLLIQVNGKGVTSNSRARQSRRSPWLTSGSFRQQIISTTVVRTGG